jgi:Skp family chaperone for outer membrane proteins
MIMKKIHKTPLAASVGIALVTLLSAASVQAEINPFSMTELSDGYMQVAEVNSGYTVKPFSKKPKRGDMNMDDMDKEMDVMNKEMDDMDKEMEDMRKGMADMNKEMMGMGDMEGMDAMNKEMWVRKWRI